MVAAHSAGQTSLNTVIELGNRLLTFPLAAVAALTFIACLRYKPDGRRRRDLVRLSAALPGGVIAQAVAGGLMVLTRPNPVMVAAHFCFFGHPEVYILALPFFGIATEILPVFSRKPLFGYKTLIAALSVLLFLWNVLFPSLLPRQVAAGPGRR